MGVNAVLRTASVTVDPGSDARCHVHIRNNGSVVDQFVFTVLGDVTGWTAVKPDKANLMPAQEVTVELTFSPKRGYEVLAGEYPFALQVASREDPHGSVVQEGRVTVADYASLAAELVPVTSKGRRKGKHTLAVDNLGNLEHPIEVRASDPDDLLVFRTKPKVPVLRPGTTSFVKLKAVPRKYFWRGNDRQMPFRVEIRSGLTDPIPLDATMVQRPMLPRRTMLLLFVLLMLLMLLVVLLSTLLRATPKTMATVAPSIPPSTSSSAPSTSSRPPITTSKPTTAKPSITPAPGAGQNQGGRSTPSTVGVNPVGDTTVRFVIPGAAYPGVTDPQLFSYVVPSGRTYLLNSMELDNPGNDRGSVRISVADTRLADYDLGSVRQTTRTFSPAVTATGGQVITMAVTCHNPSRPCAPTAKFVARPG